MAKAKRTPPFELRRRNFVATDSKGQRFAVTSLRPATHGVVATFPAIAEHVFCGQVVKGVAGGRRADSATTLESAFKTAKQLGNAHFRATDVEVVELVELVASLAVEPATA